MDAVRQWAFSACAAMVACGIAQMVLPKSNMSKIFGVTVSVFFLCCLLSPVVLQNPGLRIEVREYAQEDILRRAQRLTDEVEGQTQEAASRSVKKIVQEKLEQLGINYMDVTINMNMNGQSEGMDAVRADILLDISHEQEHDSIRSRLEEELGMTVHLGYADQKKQEG